MTEDDAKNMGEGNYPQCVYLNQYTHSLFSVNKHEIRQYNLKKGSLDSLHANIFPEGGNQSEITKFKIDKRHRKAYVSNREGQIFVINI